MAALYLKSWTFWFDYVPYLERAQSAIQSCFYSSKFAPIVYLTGEDSVFTGIQSHSLPTFLIFFFKGTYFFWPFRGTGNKLQTKQMAHYHFLISYSNISTHLKSCFWTPDAVTTSQNSSSSSVLVSISPREKSQLFSC